MSFDQVIGQNRIKKFFFASIKKHRLAHGYLFIGQSGLGKDVLGLSLAMGLNCLKKEIGGCRVCSECMRILRLEHPAFRLVLPVPTKPKTMKQEKYREIIRAKTMQKIDKPYREICYSPEFNTHPIIGIDQIRELKRDVMLRLVGDGYRVFLLSHAELMTLTAANSLLKLLEEPPEKTIFILTTSQQNKLLPTVISRCQFIHFDSAEENEITSALVQKWSFTENRARLFSKMSGGSVGRALELSDQGILEQREGAIKFLEISLANHQVERISTIDEMLLKWDKSIFRLVFQFLLIWMRDLYFIDQGLNQKVVNLDYIDRMIPFRKNFPFFNIASGIRHVEQTIDFIEKNVYLPLIVNSLSQYLKACNDPIKKNLEIQ